MSSWWLMDDPAPPLPVVELDDVDVEVVGAGITGISASLTLAEAGLRVRVRDARRVGEGASGRNGGFALRGGAMPYDRAREWLGAERAAEYWRLTEEHLDRLAGLAGDALAPHGQPAARSRRRRGGGDSRRAGGAARGRLRRRVADRSARRALSGGDLPSAATPRSSLHASCTASRHAPRPQVSRSSRAQRVESLDELDAERVLVATDGYPSGLLGALEGLIIPTRGQMIATEPVEERLFDCPHYGRHGFDYWQQTPDGRVLAGGFRDFSLDSEFTADEETTPPIQGALESFVDRARRPPGRGRAPLGRHLRPRARLPTGGRPRSG